MMRLEPVDRHLQLFIVCSKKNNVEVPKEVAGLLSCSGLTLDTFSSKSPTTHASGSLQLLNLQKLLVLI